MFKIQASELVKNRIAYISDYSHREVINFLKEIPNNF